MDNFMKHLDEKLIYEAYTSNEEDQPVSYKPVSMKQYGPDKTAVADAWKLIATADKETIEDFLYELAEAFRARSIEEEDSHFDECAEKLDDASAHLAGRGRPY